MAAKHFLPVMITVALLLGACASSEPMTPGPAESTAAPATAQTTVGASVSNAPTTTSTTTTTWAATAAECTTAGQWGTCAIDGYDQRPYNTYLPASYDQSNPIPVVIALHGGGGKAEAAITTTCVTANRNSESCLHNIAEKQGFAVVYPNGTGFGLLPTFKTWNAGGGSDGWNCVSPPACEEDIDEIAYFTALLDDLESWLNVDTGMVYATGLSNGAAMSHRLACEMSDQFAAIAAVGGTNQFSTTAACAPTTPVAIMQIHGTQDPCWTYEESSESCADKSGGRRIGVEESTTDWTVRLGCNSSPTTSEIPDTADDETSTTRTVWTECNDDVEVHLMAIEGGGHTWPGGAGRFSVRLLGRVTSDWDSSLIWEFFSNNRRN